MELTGIVQNGAIVTDGGFPLPEGAPVVVVYSGEVTPKTKGHRVKLPLVPSDQPGSLHLTGEQIAEFLAEGDVPA